MSQFTLITGGARSGKSTFAERLAAHAKRPVIYIATAQIWDGEMAIRVKKHQEQRPSSWRLIEEPLNIHDTLTHLKDEEGVILLDCVTLWLTNLLLAGEARYAEQSNPADPSASSDRQLSSYIYNYVEPEILAKVNEISQLAQEIKPKVIFVTNEVGQGIVPENLLARAYRDLAGRSNQILARQADSVYMVVAGYPIDLKPSGVKLLNSLFESEL
ncbi:bifunctional adenosylcobinamide kinase/adenosylcobinamide-phosphate guanylyltransferase [Desulfosporosinus sp.]|uniref:bifunctional adenosylcobinamide kinase/adenosylcobinamide-phosphate guanylyltransferase n=1 Tax=Desulfosporosinus sp. TaxID=157907 RepID=UPI0025BDB691|nr:bifunctional adenosylcobinamide kinase/adenosylcobinamide-phosphate guanylyltransferase [Desulfosporosinus sp.]MBC2722571.1 bifunctional adenosylcobinamide kinase/adenosylcobinamide-phosphate guanylyltransferase [Desulfosporosinus sp.]MBC2729146.1 bifunctional adenosylcobinamide kinase/adenosylcobinamide-phosphate guanylyltransferase [Desulfosporosinus sp.]